jgi:hypothetical protein
MVSNRINSEALCEDDTFPERELAALVVSKVYYQLGEYDESMVFALSAGKLFNIDHPNEYEDTIICMTLLPYTLPRFDLILNYSKMRRHVHISLRDEKPFHAGCYESCLSSAFNVVPCTRKW